MENRANALSDEIKGYFATSKYWEFEKPLGHGGYGVAILLRQKAEFGPHTQRIALKVALHREADELRNEIKWLKQVHGSKHIVRIVASCEKPSQPDWDTEPQIQEHQPLPPQTAFNCLAQLEGPVLALEYIENGSLLDFFWRMQDEDVHMSNRMLWALFLCLIRACIGMAYPIGSPIGTEPILETIPRDGRLAGDITHNDIAIRNVMLGGGDDLGEHHIGQIFKLIDFGQADDAAGPALGPTRNLRAVAELVAVMINMAGINTERTKIYKGKATLAGDIIPQRWGNPYEWLDPDLAGLIAECMYKDSRNRPTLEGALRRASDAVMNKRPGSYPEPREETNDAIQKFVQKYILNAADN
ncbi:kinase-like domain-containing protein [Xylaria bambusicola]|uniref:kinase-like domain-containing protein n=1 Tax=Xylaria bambusicola TaxID=326684 RepID=UPI002008302D|nr:kinase-like domain-containing protein [Xylaria bambusicola]KAI0515060.1 kinase-like domain-containing protein [Xylaria bambusicola]